MSELEFDDEDIHEPGTAVRPANDSGKEKTRKSSRIYSSIPFGDQATKFFSMFQAWQGKAKWQSERHLYAAENAAWPRATCTL